jgi:metal-responsive CopG/Arc/MetJ family transcriptional regulator
MPQVKTAISLPEDLFEQADELAAELDIPRSQLFAMALEELLERRRNLELLERINAAHAEAHRSADRKRRALARGRHRKLVEGQW